ncbi:MAG: glycosyltransferase [Chloroflexi bacterium]|nr:glycosyltransferase [Chloroflexota bacterium]
MSPSTVSVLLPSYNRAPYVERAIRSALDQTYQDIEVIVVDDGSTDNTGEVVRHITDPRVRYIYQENKGICGALNAAFHAANGPYIAIMGSDDIWLPELLTEEVRVLETQPGIGLVYARAQGMDVNEIPLTKFLGVPEKYPGQTFKSLIYGDHVCGITTVVRRKHIEEVGLWDENIIANEDWDMWLRLSLVCQFHFIDKVLARYRVHSGNITGIKSDRFARLTLDRVRVVDKVYARPDLPPEILDMKQVAYRNVYVDVGLRWMSARKWRESLNYFGKAVRFSGKPSVTVVRILYLIAFRDLLSKQVWGTQLINALICWRRRWAG